MGVGRFGEWEWEFAVLTSPTTSRREPWTDSGIQSVGKQVICVHG